MSDEQGFLTKTDRAFLEGWREYTGKNAKQQRYERREAIAARTRRAFSDFSLLYNELDERERNRIFDVGEGFTDADALNEFQDVLVDVLAFLYRSIEGEADSDAIMRRSFRTPFKEILGQAVAKAEVDRHARKASTSMAIVDFEVELRDTRLVDPAHAIDKIARGRPHELTEIEMYNLIHQFNPITGRARGHRYTELDERVERRRSELLAELEVPTDEEERWIDERDDPDDE